MIAVKDAAIEGGLTNALALFAKRMGVGFIAEGIETPEDLATIRQAEVPWGQGYILGEPERLILPEA